MALTKRRGFAEARSDHSDTSETELLTKDEPRSPSETPKAGSGHGESFCTAKHAILRSLAAVYAVAFLAAWLQNGALIGEKGLLPAKPAFDRERAAAEREPRKAQPSNSLSYERLQLAVQVAREIRLVEGPQVLQHAIEPRGLLLRPRVQIWRRARWPLGLPPAACALGVHVSQPEEDCHAARP